MLRTPIKPDDSKHAVTPPESMPVIWLASEWGWVHNLVCISHIVKKNKHHPNQAALFSKSSFNHPAICCHFFCGYKESKRGWKRWVERETKSHNSGNSCGHNFTKPYYGFMWSQGSPWCLQHELSLYNFYNMATGYLLRIHYNANNHVVTHYFQQTWSPSIGYGCLRGKHELKK